MNITLGSSLLYALLGYAVVFIGLGLLMAVIILVGRVMVAKCKKEMVIPVPAANAPAKPAPAPAKLAPGSAGELKLFDTDPRDAAMIMAIVADKLGKPLNELRFKSIKEVK